MTTLSIDIETYSSVDLKSAGMYRYVESEDFEVLMTSYKINDGPIVTLIDELTDEYLDLLLDPTCLKTAFNAAFEITCISKQIGTQLDPAQWDCTKVRSGMLGYPQSLAAVGNALNIELKKDRNGTALIKLFSCPNKLGERTYAHENPAKWQEYINYNIRDVEAEYEVRQRLLYLKVSDFERRLWVLDQEINARGVMVDMDFVESALEIDDENRDALMVEARELSGLDNPNSNKQMAEWLTEATGDIITSLTKENVKNLSTEYTDPTVLRVLEIKQELAKTSIKKYTAIQNCVCTDQRVRGLLQLCGAPKTGRWSGSLVQMQNLTHTKIKGLIDVPLSEMLDGLSAARYAVKRQDLEEFAMLYGNPSNTLSSLIRTAFVAPPGKTLIVSDFSAIEAVILAWLAGEQWRLDVFNTHGKIYEASASAMFNIPLDQIDKATRSKGKVAELALGYQGGVNAMERMGALKMGLQPEDLLPIVRAWRKANPKIVKFWYAIEEAAMAACEEPGKTYKLGSMRFIHRHGNLFIQLPSGRFICYVEARLRENSRGKTTIVYMGLDQITRQWTRQDTYGGKLTENVTQGIARDVLAGSLLQLKEESIDIIMHVHDEVIMEDLVERGDTCLETVKRAMTIRPSWGLDLPLKVAAFLTPFYIKD